MLIKTQDRNGLIDINNIAFKVTEAKYGYEIICYNTVCIADEGYEVLGHYSIKEKAMKVLDMIEEKYTKYSTINAVFWSVCNDERKYLIKKLKDDFVFQMPEDEEVEV